MKSCKVKEKKMIQMGQTKTQTKHVRRNLSTKPNKAGVGGTTHVSHYKVWV